MSRRLLRLAMLPVTVLALGSCRDVPTAPPGQEPGALLSVSSTLPQAITATIQQVFTKGARTSVDARWRNVIAKLDAGQVKVAHQMLAELVEWIEKNASELSPPDGETRSHAAARLVLYMALYAHRDPSQPMPELPTLGADAAMKLISPTAAATVVTSDSKAGIALAKGAVVEPTVLVIYADEDQARAACAGPLDTELCQYPGFYHFESFPHKRLTTPARVGICGPESMPERARIAHSAPSETDRVAGGILADGIEILPAVAVTDFLPCGTGGLTLSFSEFDPVDPTPQHSRYCPTETERTLTYADLDEAIANVPESNVVVVCDGTWPANQASVNRPVTIRSENPGGATLAQPDDALSGQPVLRINGVASGTVRIADLSIRLRRMGVRAIGTFDQVIIDSVHFIGPGGTTNTTGVHLDGSSVATAHVLVTRSSFSKTFNGIRQNEPVAVDTHDSRFEDIGSFGVILFSTPNGNALWQSVTGQAMQKADVVGNVFTNVPLFGFGASISIQAAGDHLIQGNTVSNTVDGVAAGQSAIFVHRGGVTAANTRPVRIRDNVVTGHGPTGDPAVANSWGIFAAIRFTSGVAGVSDTVVNNSGSHAFIGLDVNAPSEVTAFDNSFSHTYIALRKTGTSAVSITRNNFTGYTWPVTMNPPNLPGNPSLSNGSVACNWWGSAAAPAPLGPTVNPGGYLPFATQAIANTEVECNVSTDAPPVVRVCSAASGPEPTVPTIGQALQLVAAQGTIKVCDGTHSASNTNLSAKAVTIEGEGPGVPTIDGGGNNNIFRLGTLTATTAIVLRKLRFQNAGFDAVNVGQQGGSLLVDQVEFRPTQGTPPPGGTLAYHAGLRIIGSGATVKVQNSSFIGGDVGVEVNESPNVVFSLDGNTFTGQRNLAILAGSGSRLTASNNTISDCRGRWCVQVSNGPNQGSGGTFRLLNNTITVDFAHPLWQALNLHEANFEIVGNAITGIGGSRDPNDQSTWPMHSAISVNEQSTLILNGNQLSGAHTALGMSGGIHGTGMDNVISHVSAVVGHMEAVVLTRSNITNYSTPIGNNGDGNMRCNWWGTPLGPQNLYGHINADQYTPWASAPIAGTATACDPNAPPPPIVRVCSSASGTYPTVATIAGALQVVAGGGTVKVCDGTHVVQNVSLNYKAATIEGEGPGVPILDAQGSPQVFAMDDQVPRTNAVTLRRLKLINASHNGVSVGHQYGSLLIDQVEFRPTHGEITNFTQNTAYNAGVNVFEATGGGVTVQHSTFIGGDIGVHHSNSANVVIRNNTFTDHLNAAIHGGNGGSVTVSDNTITGCSPSWCIYMGGAATTGTYSFYRNTLTTDMAHQVRNAIHAGDGTFVFDGNVLTGVGGTRDPNDWNTWPIQVNAIAVFGSVTLIGNEVTGANNAFMLGGATGTATDNIVHDVASPINLDNSTAPTSMAVHRNDFYNFFKPIATDFSVSSVTCNWWGTAAGPNMPGTISASLYTPWATTPIAKQPGVTCP